MARTVLAGLVLAVAAWLAIQALVTTDLEAVEEEIARLVSIANAGGDEAVAAILDALAPDYRGSSPFTRSSIERNLLQYLGASKSRDIRTGDPSPIWKGDEILVPLLSLRATVDGGTRTVILSVTFARRDGEWRVVDVSRAQWGR